MQPRHGTHRPGKHLAPSELLQDRSDPAPGTHRTPAAAPWLASPCSGERERGQAQLSFLYQQCLRDSETETEAG